jgi:hypothetical protein
MSLDQRRSGKHPGQELASKPAIVPDELSNTDPDVAVSIRQSKVGRCCSNRDQTERLHFGCIVSEGGSNQTKKGP